MKYLYLLPLALMFSACNQANPTPTKTTETIQTTPPKKGFCTKIYLPVCAKVEIECITTPCKPIEQTFSNKCEMGNNDKATFLHNGKCK